MGIQRANTIEINIPGCPNCADGTTTARMLPEGKYMVIRCEGCDTELKRWRDPVVWVNGEPVEVSMRRLDEPV